MLRSLYKIVPTENIPQIMEHGLKPSRDGIKGVFLFSINDLKYWNHCQITQKNGKHIPNLLQALIYQADNHIRTHNLSLVKINMKDLERDKFRIREEQLLLEDTHALNTWMKKLKIDRKTFRGFIKYAVQMYKVLCHGESLSRAKIHTNNKKAIEYIYQGRIPRDKIELVGSCDNVKGKPLIDIFSELTKGKPEEKNVVSQLL